MSEAHLECSRCGAPFREADIDARKQSATCRFCGAVTALSSEPEAPPTEVVAKAPAEERPVVRPKVPRPRSIRVEDTTDGLRLTYRWFSPVLFILLFFCIFWDGFLVAWYWMGIAGFGAGGPFVWIMLLFPIAHVAVGVGLTYATIAGFLNRTWIDLTRDSLSVRHGPIPWKGNKSLAADDIDQLYCRMNVSNSSRNSQMTYTVNALLKDGREEKLATFNSADEARFVERTLEEALGVEHHAVAGELG